MSHRGGRCSTWSPLPNFAAPTLCAGVVAASVDSEPAEHDPPQFSRRVAFGARSAGDPTDAAPSTALVYNSLTIRSHHETQPVAFRLAHCVRKKGAEP